MIWFVAVATGWAIVAVLLGLLIGNGIRLERGRESGRPSPAVTACPVVGAGVGAGIVDDEVGADTVEDAVAAAAR